MRLKPLEVEAEGQGRIPPRDKRDLRVNRVNRGAGNGNRTRIPSLEGWSSTIELSPHAFGESTKSTMSTRSTGSPDSSGSGQLDPEDPVDLEDLIDMFWWAGKDLNLRGPIKAGRSTVCCVQPGFATRPRTIHYTFGVRGAAT